MQKIILTILLLSETMCIAAYPPHKEVEIGGNWMQLANNSGYYIDLYTIRKNGDKLKLWIMDEKDENGSNKFQVEFDCKGETMRLIHMENYSSSGGILASSNVSDVEKFQPIVPNSIGQYIFKSICSLNI